MRGLFFLPIIRPNPRIQTDHRSKFDEPCYVVIRSLPPSSSNIPPPCSAVIHSCIFYVARVRGGAKGWVHPSEICNCSRTISTTRYLDERSLHTSHSPPPHPPPPPPPAAPRPLPFTTVHSPVSPPISYDAKVLFTVSVSYRSRHCTGKAQVLIYLPPPAPFQDQENRESNTRLHESPSLPAPPSLSFGLVPGCLLTVSLPISTEVR